jgi:hypothetical protein
VAKRNAQAGIQPGTWLHRTETATAKDGAPLTIHYRRRVEAVDGDRLRLGGIERAETPVGNAPSDWEPWGGILGMGASTTADKLAASVYRPEQPPEKTGRKQQ